MKLKMELEKKVIICERVKNTDKISLMKQKHEVSVHQIKVRFSYTTFSQDTKVNHRVREVQEKSDARIKRKKLTYYGYNLVSYNIYLNILSN